MQPTQILLLCLFLLFALLLLTALLYLLTLRPNRRRRATDSYTAHNYAHRGLFDNESIPENSLAAFEAACEAGYGIELDVALSRDGVAMVFHDDTLTRVCGVDKRISECTAEELGRTPLCGCAAHTVPTFRAVLDTVRGRVPLIVEIKVNPGEEVEPVCRAAAALLDQYEGAYCIESFHPLAVRWFRINRPLVVRGQLSDVFHLRPDFSASRLMVELLCLNFYARPDFIAFDHRHSRHLPLRLCRSLFGVRTFAWTPRGQEEIERALTAFDAVIFENGRPPERNTKA